MSFLNSTCTFKLKVFQHSDDLQTEAVTYLNKLNDKPEEMSIKFWRKAAR